MQSALIEFRVADGDKQAIIIAANAAGMSVSELLRRACRAAASGRIASRSVLSDLVLVRSAANRLVALADKQSANPAAIIECVRATAEDLRTIAAKHLENAK